MAARRRCASTVARKWQAADGIAGFELQPIKGLLPTFQPGAHIDVHMPNGEIRQYSITNGPGETDSYHHRRQAASGIRRAARTACTKRCARATCWRFPSRATISRCAATRSRRCSSPAASASRRCWPWRRRCKNQDLAHELHYFAQGEEHLAFPDRLRSLGGSLDAASRPHAGADRREVARAAVVLPRRHASLSSADLARCWRLRGGSRPSRAGPRTAVHFEYFKNTNKIDDSSSFEVALARSCVTLAGAGRQDDPAR